MAPRRSLPKSPAPFKGVRAEREFPWCQRCVRALANPKNDPADVVGDGCEVPAGTSKCSRCTKGNHPCVPVPSRFWSAVDKVCAAAIPVEEGEEPALSTNQIRKKAAELGKAFTSHKKEVTKASEGFGVSTPSKPSAATGSGANVGITDLTGQQIVEALRALTAVLAQAHNITLPRWSGLDDYQTGEYHEDIPMEDSDNDNDNNGEPEGDSSNDDNDNDGEEGVDDMDVFD